MLHPASGQARDVVDLFWVMTIGAVVIWLLVMGLAFYAAWGRRKPSSTRFADPFILICGFVLPTLVVFLLMAVSLRLLPAWGEDDPPDLRIEVTGEQFWWRVAYLPDDQTRIETANVIRLPQHAQVEFLLKAEDVIHSFWVPPLGGKLDMIPGRTNVLRLQADQIGRYRGVCAEFCGLSHGLMAFEVEVMAQADFTAWLQAEAAPAVTDLPDAAFKRAGCAACHQIRGRIEEGAVGPDLTHLAARDYLGAGTLPMSRQNLQSWLHDPQAHKPGALMPAYHDLPEADLREILDLLEALQ